MPSLSKIIVDSVDEKYIIQYLKKHNIVYSDDDQGKEVNYWVDELFKENKVDIGDFENFLFDELFYGKRKYSRMYRIEKPSSLSNPIDWFEKYQRTFCICITKISTFLILCDLAVCLATLYVSFSLVFALMRYLQGKVFLIRFYSPTTLSSSRAEFRLPSRLACA